MSDLLPLGPCQSFAPGHQTHWIMAKQFRSKGSYGVVTGFEGNRVVVEMPDGTTYRWWHHHPQRLRLAVAARGTRVKVFRTLPAIQVAGAWFYCSTGPSACVLGFVAGEVHLGTITGDAHHQDEPTFVDQRSTPLDTL